MVKYFTYQTTLDNGSTAKVEGILLVGNKKVIIADRECIHYIAGKKERLPVSILCERQIDETHKNLWWGECAFDNLDELLSVATLVDLSPTEHIFHWQGRKRRIEDNYTLLCASAKEIGVDGLPIW